MEFKLPWARRCARIYIEWCRSEMTKEDFIFDRPWTLDEFEMILDKGAKEMSQ